MTTLPMSYEWSGPHIWAVQQQNTVYHDHVTHQLWVEWASHLSSTATEQSVSWPRYPWAMSGVGLTSEQYSNLDLITSNLQSFIYIYTNKNSSSTGSKKNESQCLQNKSQQLNNQPHQHVPQKTTPYTAINKLRKHAQIQHKQGQNNHIFFTRGFQKPFVSQHQLYYPRKQCN